MGDDHELRFLGTVSVSRGGKPVGGFRSRKALALLGYLAVQSQPSPRDQLAGLFWETQTEARGRANLSWVLNRISALLPDRLRADPHTVALQRSPNCQLDVDAFERLLARGDPAALAEAVALYRGEFLAGLVLDGCAEFEVWLEGERERWRQRVVGALETLVAHHRRLGEPAEALTYARRLLALEPWREGTHRTVMGLLARCGRHSAALAQYEACRRTLSAELGVEPAEETTALYERLRAAAAAPRHSLPPQPTAFVGREAELAELLAWLDSPDGRLVTVCGPGGIGKTRLALEAAAARAEAFIEGARFVPLAAVGSPEFLASALAAALQLPGSHSTAAQVLGYLRNREMLLVLDNVEHLLCHAHQRGECTQLLEAILTQAPGVKLLVTSRERLKLRWERCFELGGLACPDDEAAPAGELEGYAAVRLFVQAARRVARRFDLAGNATSVAHICRLVEGVPLAIELAAGSVKTHTCAEIARRIEGDLGFLASSLQDVPPRHRSMRAAIAHSWRLLTPTEQQVMMRLSVFREGFTHQAARRVAGAPPPILESLVDRSLVRFLPSGRHEMAELLRQYAAEALAASPEALTRARDRHCAYYLTLLAAREDEFRGAAAAQAVEALRPEVANVRTAWLWAVTQAALADIERSLRALSRLYLLVGPYQEGEALIGAAVQRVRPLVKKGQAPALALPGLLVQWARLLNHCGEFDQAIEAAEEAVQLAPGAGEDARAAAGGACLQWGQALMRQGRNEEARARFAAALGLSRRAARRDLEAAALTGLGNVCHTRSDLAAAADRYQQALAIADETGDERSECTLQARLGLVAHQQGHYPHARAHYAQALRISRAVGDRWAEALALVNLGYVCDSQGDYAQARLHYRQSLRIARETGDRQAESIALACLGLLAHHLGDDEAATAQGRLAVRIAREIGDRRVLAYALTRRGHTLLRLGRVAEAVHAYQQAAGIRHQLGQEDLAMESLAGLARVHLAEGDKAQALACVEEILERLQTSDMLGTDEPLRIRLTCYRTLRALEDPRAPAVLAAARRLLEAQAARIDDAALRRSFLEDVPAHRELRQETLS